MAETLPGNVAGDADDREAVGRLNDLLMIERRGTDPGERHLAGPHARKDEALDLWLATAGALAAGEPKRALAVLRRWPQGRPESAIPSSADEHAQLARALQTAAVAMDSNWQPGTSFVPLRPEAAVELFNINAGIEAAIGSVTDTGLRLGAHLAGRLAPVLFFSRISLGHARSAVAAEEGTVRCGARAPWTEWDLSVDTRELLKWFDALYEEIAGLGNEDAAYHLLLAADLTTPAVPRPARH
ncbi:hypothetical protein GCM10012280_71940 [Wenjunlia tyrosinilytica]|uniref:Uncharacterized protein n=1 Tax=Wenjunlia tyrosinilytica TaxID=1544741 RepID=A0A918A0W4_9ACTN|nr:hypothetical protein [Wenjunlia tyrosinilytica]GGP01324.1 hypothetical protein GCM10012280_71940 [Wenjunlia tyrosinilytica]